MLTAYFDASRTQEGRPYVAVGGCLASIEKWQAFELKWQVILDREKLPYFHMTDFEAYQEFYKDWTRAKHKSVLKEIADIITPHTDFAFGRGVAIEDWEYVQAQNKAHKPWSAFTYCANQCLHSIANWANDNNHSGPIMYVFEHGDGFNGELNALKEAIESDEARKKRFRWGGLHIVPKLKANPPYPLTPLQAADVWAFEARKDWENKYALGGNERLREVRFSIRLLLQGTGIQHNFGYSNRDNLINLEPYYLKEQ